jgi:hypothetical protein
MSGKREESRNALWVSVGPARANSPLSVDPEASNIRWRADTVSDVDVARRADDFLAADVMCLLHRAKGVTRSESVALAVP